MSRPPPSDPSDAPRPRRGDPPDVDATRPMPGALPPTARPDPLDDPGLRRPAWALPADQRPAPPDPAVPLPPLPRAPTPPPIAPLSRPAQPTPPRPARRPLRQRPLVRLGAAVVALLLLGLCVWIVPLLLKGGQVIGEIFVTPGPHPIFNGTPITTTFPDWNKKERVNILLLGLDTREEGNTRSDTMIVVSIDPANNTVGMMSIPRDLWVPIPGFGDNRINAAYQLGLSGGQGGGGPALAAATVSQNLGLPIHYFVEVDFEGFARVVDALEGITVDVPRPLLDNEYPAENFSYMRIYIPGGLQHMDGHTALQYVRSRHADSDLGRNQRQQGVLLAIKQKGLQIGVLSKLDKLLSQVQGTLRTDLSFQQAGSLIQLAGQVPAENIHSYAIGADMTTPTNINGQEVLVPDWDKIRAQVRTMVSDPRLGTEATRLVVLNGTTTAGLARRTADRLAALGYTIASVDSAPDAGSHPHTSVVDYTGGQKPFTVQQLRAALRLGSDAVRPGAAADRPPGTDLVVVVGDDAAGP